MKKTGLFAIALAIALGGCAAGRIGQQGFSSAFVTLPLASSPNVFIRNGYIVVDQEPIIADRNTERPTVSWALPSDGEYYFPDDKAISFPGSGPKPQQFDCIPKAVPTRTLICNWKKDHGKKYLYQITVTNGTSPPLKSDPSIMDD